MSQVLSPSEEKLATQFLDLKTPYDLAELLEVDYKKLYFYAHIAHGEKKYHSFTIPKKSGGIRQIQSPAIGLRILQRKLNQVFRYV